MRTPGSRRTQAGLVCFALIAGACSQTHTLEVAHTQTIDEAADHGGHAPVGRRRHRSSTIRPQPDGGPTGPPGCRVAGRRRAPGSSRWRRSPTSRRSRVRSRSASCPRCRAGRSSSGSRPTRSPSPTPSASTSGAASTASKLDILGYDVCTNCPDEGLAQAKKAVEKDKVFALANTFVVNASLDQVVPYLNEKKVPMVQGSSGSQSRKPELSPYNFSVGLTVPNRAAIGADFAKKYLEEKGLPKKVALLYFTDALTSFIAENQRAALEAGRPRDRRRGGRQLRRHHDQPVEPGREDAGGRRRDGHRQPRRAVRLQHAGGRPGRTGRPRTSARSCTTRSPPTIAGQVGADRPRRLRRHRGLRHRRHAGRRAWPTTSS